MFFFPGRKDRYDGTLLFWAETSVKAQQRCLGRIYRDVGEPTKVERSPGRGEKERVNLCVYQLT